jgi:hypothetical protein
MTINIDTKKAKRFSKKTGVAHMKDAKANILPK